MNKKGILLPTIAVFFLIFILIAVSVLSSEGDRYAVIGSKAVWVKYFDGLAELDVFAIGKTIDLIHIKSLKDFENVDNKCVDNYFKIFDEYLKDYFENLCRGKLNCKHSYDKENIILKVNLVYSSDEKDVVYKIDEEFKLDVGSVFEKKVERLEDQPEA